MRGIGMMFGGSCGYLIASYVGQRSSSGVSLAEELFALAALSVGLCVTVLIQIIVH